MNFRAVFDCMVFLQAVARPAGPAMACFHALEQHDGTLCLSPSILLEVGEVLSRPELQAKFPRLRASRVAEFLSGLQGLAVTLPDAPPAFRLARDPNDEKYVNLAITASAAYLVSRDNDLLDLMREGDPEAQRLNVMPPRCGSSRRRTSSWC